MFRNLFLISTLSIFLLAVSACGSSSSSGAEEEQEGPRFGTINEEQLQRMREVAPEDDGPFYMVNLIKFREQADYLDGRETDLTGREANELYAPLEFLDAIGAEIMFVGTVEETLITYDGTQWDQVAVVLYPSRALFLQMNADPEFQARAIHKEAGVEKTIVMVSHLQESLSPPPPEEVPNPATPEDPEVAIAHLLKYNEVADYGPDSSEPERTGQEAMTMYQQAAAPVALEQGVNPLAWFVVEGVLIGDGREWEEFRINLFPSHAAFDAVVADPTRKAGEVHREAAIEDTYTTSNEVVINAFVEDGGLLEVTDNGMGTLCGGDDGCTGLEADKCLSDGGSTGFCTVEGCTAGTCEGSYLCCHDCADFAADLLPFDGSACLPTSQTSALTGAAQCTCD